jgi:hypothetical protein
MKRQTNRVYAADSCGADEIPDGVFLVRRAADPDVDAT